MDEAAKRLEGKLGFDRVRSLIADRCSTDYAAERGENEELSTDPSVIRKRLQLTDEMRLILMFEENFPTSGYIDCLHFLEPIGKNASIDLLSLGRLRTMLDTLRKVTNFFRGIKDGIYPALKQLSSGFPGFPEVQRIRRDQGYGLGQALRDPDHHPRAGDQRLQADERHPPEGAAGRARGGRCERLHPRRQDAHPGGLGEETPVPGLCL